MWVSGTKYLLMSSCGSDPCPFGGKHACVCDADGRDGDILIRVIGPDTCDSRPEGQDKFARASTLVFESILCGLCSLLLRLLRSGALASLLFCLSLLALFL